MAENSASCLLINQLSSVSGRGRQALAAWPSPWKDPAGQRCPSTTAKTDPAGCRTLLRSPVDKTPADDDRSLVVSLRLTSLPSSPGDYEISVKFNDQHIPDSPYLVPVVAPANDARRLTVTGLQVRHEETPPHPAGPCLAKGLRGAVA